MKIKYYICAIIMGVISNFSNAQLLGEETAIDLNYKYNRIVDCSYNLADFNCSGIIIHTFDPDAESWYPSLQGQDRGVVSFSWLRNDINVYRDGDSLGSIWGEDTVAGIIFHSTEGAVIQDLQPVEILCAYGVNGDTKSRENLGCGMNSPNETIPNPDNYSSCSPLGVTTAEELVDKYFIQKEGAYGLGVLDQCSFSSEKQEFKEAMKVGALSLPYMVTSTRNNEIIVKEWSAIPSKEIPIQAFFYTINYKYGVNEAKKIVQDAQIDYYLNTGRMIPIISVDMKVIREGYPDDYVSPFEYNPEDQNKELNKY